MWVECLKEDPTVVKASNRCLKVETPCIAIEGVSTSEGEEGATEAAEAATSQEVDRVSTLLRLTKACLINNLPKAT
jgi:hypothetical protein